MPDPRTDRIARHAARLLHSGKADDVDDAIRRAAESAHAPDAPRPSRALVRKHFQAMSMQSLGDVGYRQSILDVLARAENIMTIFEDYDPILVGCAAQGHVDAGVTFHIRVFTTSRIGELAQMLVDAGYEEPRFDTADTRYGRFDRLSFSDSPATHVSVTRILPDRRRELDRTDLFTGEPIAQLDLPALRRRLNEPRP